MTSGAVAPWGSSLHRRRAISGRHRGWQELGWGCFRPWVSGRWSQGGQPSWPEAPVVGGGDAGIQTSRQGRQRRGEEQVASELLTTLPGPRHCLTLAWPQPCAAGWEPQAQSRPLGLSFESGEDGGGAPGSSFLGGLCALPFLANWKIRLPRRFVSTAPLCKYLLA